MSADLQDLRAKVTPETDAVLEAQHRATGRDKSVIAREVLHEWAMEQIHAANVLASQLKAKGLTGIEGGAAGKRRDSRGTAGSGGE